MNSLGKFSEVIDGVTYYHERSGTLDGEKIVYSDVVRVDKADYDAKCLEADRYRIALEATHQALVTLATKHGERLPPPLPR